MSSIGSGPGIGSASVLETAAVRAIGLSDGAASLHPESRDGAQPAMATASAPVMTSTALDAGAAPIDQDRVASIRKAIADHDYPLVPAKIGEAMIAAGMLLRISK